MSDELSLPFEFETELERRIAEQPRWRSGVEWGRARHGHPEGTVKLHIAAVLANVDRLFGDSPLRRDLRLIALVHDTFKGEVDPTQSRTGENHHGMRARRFAESLIDNERVLDVIELHDEAYNAWQRGARDGKCDAAAARAKVLIGRLGADLDLYLAFYQCDNETEGKDQECLRWFRELADGLRGAPE
jgi:hypothetical protein